MLPGSVFEDQHCCQSRFLRSLSLSETLYAWRAGANRVMLILNGRCSRAAVVYPSGVGRLLRIGEINDASVFDWGVVRESVHKSGYGHKFAGATTIPVVA